MQRAQPLVRSGLRAFARLRSGEPGRSAFTAATRGADVHDSESPAGFIVTAVQRLVAASAGARQSTGPNEDAPFIVVSEGMVLSNLTLKAKVSF